MMIFNSMHFFPSAIYRAWYTQMSPTLEERPHPSDSMATIHSRFPRTYWLISES